MKQHDLVRYLERRAGRDAVPVAELAVQADSAKAAADRACVAIDRALAFIDASNKRIAAMEVRAVRPSRKSLAN